MVKQRSSVLRRGVRLHVGSGRERLDGWVNLDVQDLPGVDVVADVTEGLDFTQVEAVYAEHFLEHLRIDRAVDFLTECHRVMADGARLRLSTPNLDWVWTTHYHPDSAPADKVLQAVALNRAFHGWRHQFLWNREMLERVLTACGFDDVTFCRWGESEHEIFRGIERHETYPDTDELPHVLVVEARKGAPRRRDLAELRADVERDFLAHLAD